MSFEFQSTLYPTQTALCAAIAYEWITAGGSNSPEQVTEVVTGVTAEALADEAISSWGLDRPAYQDESQTWMQFRSIGRDDIVAACREFLANRPDWQARQAEALQAIHDATGGDLYSTTWQGGSWMVPAVETRETLADFEAASNNYRECGAITRGTLAGVPFVSFGEVQVRKGDPRRELTVLDLGDVRVALKADVSDWADEA